MACLQVPDKNSVIRRKTHFAKNTLSFFVSSHLKETFGSARNLDDILGVISLALISSVLLGCSGCGVWCWLRPVPDVGWVLFSDGEGR